MQTRLTQTGAEIQELLNKIGETPSKAEIQELLNKMTDDTFMVISPLSGSGVIADAFKKFSLSDKTGRNLTCLIKKEAFEEKYTVATLRVEKYINIGYRLDFFIDGPIVGVKYDADFGTYDPVSSLYSPDVRFDGAKNLAYIYNPDNDYVIPLGEGSAKISLASDAIIDTKGYRKQVIIDKSMITTSTPPNNEGSYSLDISRLEWLTGKTLDEWWSIVESGEYDIILRYNEISSSYSVPACIVRYIHNTDIVFIFDLTDDDNGIQALHIAVGAGRIFFGEVIPAVIFTRNNRDMLVNHNTAIQSLESRLTELELKVTAITTQTNE